MSTRVAIAKFLGFKFSALVIGCYFYLWS